jgi:hypothetical protein
VRSLFSFGSDLLGESARSGGKTMVDEVGADESL